MSRNEFFWCEQAKLYLGFSIQVTLKEEREEKDNKPVAIIAKEYILKYVLLTPYVQPLLQLLQRVQDEYE
jgi:hypothetical protein